MKEIILYELENGTIPFEKWFQKLDGANQNKVEVRLSRLKFGLYGQYKNLPKRISELKFASGLRVYYSEFNGKLILLLCGGNKTRQSKDIKQAEIYLQNYKERFEND